MTDNYLGPERRANPRTLDEIELTFDRKLRDHEEREEERIKVMVGALFATAFPDGPAKHFDYHLSKINAAKEEAEFWKAAKLKLIEGGVGAIAGVLKTLIVLALVGLLYKLGLGTLAAGIVK